MAKILIISASFDAGDAITMMNLFSRWNKRDLYLASPSQTPYMDYFSSFYYLGRKERKSLLLFRPWVRVPQSCVLSKAEKQSCENNVDGERKQSLLEFILFFVYKKTIFPILQYTGWYNRRYNLKISNDFKHWVEVVMPDIIYSPVSNEAIMKFLIEFQNVFPSKKYVFHSFDDWFRPAYKILFNRHYVQRLDNLFRVLISKSDLLLSTTNMMSKDFEIRYGKKFSTFYNPVDVSNDVNVLNPFSDVNYHIVYIGKIAWHNALAIQNMHDAIALYNEHYIKKIVLDIYTTTSKENLDYFKIKLDRNVILHHPIPNSEVVSLLRNADFLFLPITISINVASFVKYSMSTKMGEYLFSGTPLIYCGPDGIAMTNFVKENQVAFYTTENGPQSLLHLLEQCVGEPSFASYMAGKGKDLARCLFDKNKISEEFYNLFVSLLTE